MTWFLEAISRSLGKKQCVALTGLALCVFLVVHLSGNLLLLKGRDAFNGYAATLEGIPIVPVVEIGLLLTFLVHIGFSALVTLENFKARPIRYAVKRWEGGRTVGSATMWLSGPVVLAFLINHVLRFRFADAGGKTLYDMVAEAFQSLPYVVWYVFAAWVLALHLSHGFQSAVRTLGMAHPKYTPLASWAGWLFAILVGVGYSLIPIWMHCTTP